MAPGYLEALAETPVSSRTEVSPPRRVEVGEAEVEEVDQDRPVWALRLYV